MNAPFDQLRVRLLSLRVARCAQMLREGQAHEDAARVLHAAIALIDGIESDLLAQRASVLCEALACAALSLPVQEAA